MSKQPDIRALGVPAGVDDEMIGKLVTEFYGSVQRDTFIGPVFAARVADWEPHLNKMRDFWSSITLMSGRYKGKPIPIHSALPDISEAHFSRWLDLFREAAGKVCPPSAAALFIDRAERIAESLKLGIAFHRDVNRSLTDAPNPTADSERHRKTCLMEKAL